MDASHGPEHLIFTISHSRRRRLPRHLGNDIDITERRRAESLLKDLNVTLERRVTDSTGRVARERGAVQGIDGEPAIGGGADR